MTRLHGPAVGITAASAVIFGCLWALALMRVFSTVVGLLALAMFIATSAWVWWHKTGLQPAMAPARSRGGDGGLP